MFLLKNHIPGKYQGTIVAFMMGKDAVYKLYIFITFIRKTSTTCFFCSRINEFAKQTQGEMGKMAQTRIMWFDISFLMLCHISQVYGLEVNLQLSKFFYMYLFWPMIRDLGLFHSLAYTACSCTCTCVIHNYSSHLLVDYCPIPRIFRFFFCPLGYSMSTRRWEIQVYR